MLEKIVDTLFAIGGIGLLLFFIISVTNSILYLIQNKYKKIQKILNISIIVIAIIVIIVFIVAACIPYDSYWDRA